MQKRAIASATSEISFSVSSSTYVMFIYLYNVRLYSLHLIYPVDNFGRYFMRLLFIKPKNKQRFDNKRLQRHIVIQPLHHIIPVYDTC